MMELGLNLQLQHNQWIEIVALLWYPGSILLLFPDMYIRRLDPLFANSEGTLRSFESIRVPSSTEGLNSISTRFLIPGTASISQVHRLFSLLPPLLKRRILHSPMPL
ncbi:hypothetical protein BS47DRAFT_187477 [Hydnum rufescens UP504]|uniref:Uncharacterized protein n=1 Tax=Hydnum rufescens UP504 TaxID=1448309 RepID=A0A9P6DS00_9AGAM|nr:hypothetical protein BS47DRAFT_187477 [Hydnum rufescens UP504]